MGIKITTEKVGIPIELNGLEFTFDTSPENLAKFLDIEGEISGKIKELDKKRKGVKIDQDEEGNVDRKTFEKVIDLGKESLRIQMDVILGDGAFDKVYPTCPDFDKLQDILDELGKGIHDELDELSKKRKKENAKRVMEYKKHKNQK